MEVEFVAIFRGIQLRLPLGARKLHVESESLIAAIQELNEGATSMAQHSTLIKEILELKERFQECSFMYVSRVGNEVAHKLAGHAWHIGNLHVWGEDFPEFIWSQVWMDLHLTQLDINEVFYLNKKRADYFFFNLLCLFEHLVFFF